MCLSNFFFFLVDSLRIYEKIVCDVNYRIQATSWQSLVTCWKQNGSGTCYEKFKIITIKGILTICIQFSIIFKRRPHTYLEKKEKKKKYFYSKTFEKICKFILIFFVIDSSITMAWILSFNMVFRYFLCVCVFQWGGMR